MHIPSSKIVSKIETSLKRQVKALTKKKHHPQLTTILVGRSTEQLSYVAIKKKMASDLGITFNFKHHKRTPMFQKFAQSLKDESDNPSTTGMIIQQPLPPQLNTHSIYRYIAKAKDPNDPFKLMGFGHRVYKNFDPRAKILKGMRDKLQSELGINSKLIEVANRVEEIALSDDYFISRNLYPNIDFYSGTILSAMNIPRSLFTPIFVIGRTVGWITQWIEQKRAEIDGVRAEADRFLSESPPDFAAAFNVLIERRNEYEGSNLVKGVDEIISLIEQNALEYFKTYLRKK